MEPVAMASLSISTTRNIHHPSVAWNVQPNTWSNDVAVETSICQGNHTVLCSYSLIFVGIYTNDI